MTFPTHVALRGKSLPPPEQQSLVCLRALIQRPRSLALPELREALVDAECWTAARAENATGLCLRLELSLRMVTELYPGLVACGLEFDRASHRALTALCTLRRHVLLPGRLRRPVELQLDIQFADAAEPGEFPRCRPQA